MKIILNTLLLLLQTARTTNVTNERIDTPPTAELVKELLNSDSSLKCSDSFKETLIQRKEELIQSLRDEDSKSLAQFITDCSKDSSLRNSYYELVISFIFELDGEKAAAIKNKLPSDLTYIKETINLFINYKSDILKLFKKKYTFGDEISRELYLAIFNDSYGVFGRYFKRHYTGKSELIKEVLESTNMASYGKLFFISCLMKFTSAGDKLKNDLGIERLAQMSFDADCRDRYFVRSPWFTGLVDHVDFKELDTECMVRILDYLIGKNVDGWIKEDNLCAFFRGIAPSSNPGRISFQVYNDFCSIYDRDREKYGLLMYTLSCSESVEFASKVQIPSKNEMVSFFKMIMNSDLRIFASCPQMVFAIFNYLEWNDKKAVLNEVLDYLMMTRSSEYKNRNEIIRDLSEKYGISVYNRSTDSKIVEYAVPETMIALLDSIDMNDYRENELEKKDSYLYYPLHQMVQKQYGCMFLIEKMVDLDADVAFEVILGHCQKGGLRETDYKRDDFSFAAIEDLVLRKKNSKMATRLISFYREHKLNKPGVEFARKVIGKIDDFEFTKENCSIVSNDLAGMGEKQLAVTFLNAVSFKDELKNRFMKTNTSHFSCQDDVENMKNIMRLLDESNISANDLVPLFTEKILFLLGNRDYLNKLDSFLGFLDENRGRFSSTQLNYEDLNRVLKYYETSIGFKTGEDILRYFKMLVSPTFASDKLKNIRESVEDSGPFAIPIEINADGISRWNMILRADRGMLDSADLKQKILKMISSYN